MREFNLGCVTAYGDAKKAGYTGSYNDFCAILANLTAGSGVTSYLELTDKPRINGVELTGNVTSEDLGLHTRGSRVEITTPSQQLFGQTVTLTDGDETLQSTFDSNGKCVFDSVLMGGTMIASATYGGRTSRSYVQCPYFTNYKTTLVWSEHGIYSFIVDHSTPDLEVTYDDDASGMIAGSDNWLINEPFNNINPCLLRGGVVVAYLDKNDYTKDINGNPVTTQSGDDIMIEIPRLGVKAEWIDSDHLKVSISTGANVSGFDYTAFSAYNNNDSDKLYIHVDSASINATLDDKVTTKPNPVKTIISEAKQKGDGYFAMGFAQRQLIVLLYMLFHKTVSATGTSFMGMTNILRSEDYLAGLIGVNNSASDSTYKVMLSRVANDFVSPVGNNEPKKYVADLPTHDELCPLSTGYIEKPLGNSKLVFYPDYASTAQTGYGRWYSATGYANVTSRNLLTGGEYINFYSTRGSYKSGGTTYYIYSASARQMYLHIQQ